MSDKPRSEQFDQSIVGQAEQEVIPPQDLREKILAAWGSARDQLGAPNNYRLAELLYKSFYNPGGINDSDIVNREGFNRKETLSAPLSGVHINWTNQPTEEEFINTVRRAMTLEAKFDSALHEGAHELISELAKLGPVKVWTTGDVHGSPGTGHHGSREQYKRAAIAGIGDLRKKIADELGKHRRDVLSVSASEDKFELLPGILEEFKEQGIDILLILEDRASNLVRAVEQARLVGLQSHPIWVRQGAAMDLIPNHPEQSIEEWKQELNAVNSIQEAITKLADVQIPNGEHAASLVDYDDVLSDDAKRQEVQIESVTNALRNKGWIE